MTMHHIATETRTSSGYGFSFTNIPQTFTHLRVHAKLRQSASGTGANAVFYINGDTGTNYRVNYVGGDGGTIFSGDFGAGQTFAQVGWTGNTAATAGLFSTHILDIVDYTGSTFKTVRCINGFDANNSTTNLVGQWSSLWKNTAAITSLGFNGNEFAAGSTISIYGISTPNVTGV
jgi:hypothetical protein